MRRIGTVGLVVVSASLALAQTETIPANDMKRAAAPGEDAPAKEDALKPVDAARALAMRLPQIAFDEAPLSDVLDHLAELTGINLIVMWRAVEDAGVRRDTAVTLNVRNARLSQVLWLVLNQPGIAEARLAYRADSDLLLLTTAEDLGRDMIVRVYDVQDLLVRRPRFATIEVGRLHDVPIGNTVAVANGAVAARPVIGRYFGGVTTSVEDSASTPASMTKDDMLRRLIDVITNTIQPETWVVNGGNGTISSFNGNLVIRNSPLVHQQIVGALREP
jgi:hypothetical protein